MDWTVYICDGDEKSGWNSGLWKQGLLLCGIEMAFRKTCDFPYYYIYFFSFFLYADHCRGIFIIFYWHLSFVAVLKCHLKCIKYWLILISLPGVSLLKAYYIYKLLVYKSQLGKHNWASKVRDIFFIPRRLRVSLAYLRISNHDIKAECGWIMCC